jgi:large subunit ribosomal protein L35
VATTKMKTNKGVKKRFKITATGKLKRTKPGRRHILNKKSTKRKRNLKRPGLVSEGHAKVYKKVI